MSARDSEHWLWRLDAPSWLEAARAELEQGSARVDSRRTAITHARRAAGMALNGVLVEMHARGWSAERCETAWGRSYIDHLRTLANASEGAREPFDAVHCESCRALLSIAVVPSTTGLVRLGRSKDDAAAHALELAARIVHACATWITP